MPKHLTTLPVEEALPSPTGLPEGYPVLVDDVLYVIDGGVFARFGGQKEAVNTVAASGAAQTIPDPAVKKWNHITLTANCTFTLPAAGAGKEVRMSLKQDATGSRTATWPGTVKWPGGAAPTLTTTASKTDDVVLRCFDGTNWHGEVVGQNI